MLNATIAARRLLSRLRGDATDPEPRVSPASRPGLGLARRADAALRGVARRPRPAPHPVPAARPARDPLALLRRLEAPERLVPTLVAALLLVASVTAVPGLAGGSTGGTKGGGTAPRIAVGGDAVPFAVEAVEAAGPNDGAGVGVDPGIELDESAAQVAAGQAVTEGAPDVTGQFLADGTLLKPVVVETTVEDGRDKLRRYKVRSGDTLTGIASRHGVSMMTLWWANKLKSKDDLKVGQVLVIPPVNGLIHEVKSGDTLEAVAKANDVDADRVVALNELTSQTLVIGQVLILPGARGEAYPTPKPTKRPTVRAPTVSRPTTRNTSRSTTKPPSRYTGGAFAWPVAGGYISQYFRYGHPALDIAADYGTGVKAAAAGKVIFAGWKSNGGGYQIWISHGSGLYTTYNHLSSVAVSSGRSVGRGSFIGRIGTSGWSTGPHLHFEVWRGGIWNGGSRVNPLGYL